MSAKCASCHYPLSVCDSVACRECSSHFHIDCAQLVGFPLFELSVDPIKNTFHCSTCQLLPLPIPRGDSDSEDEGMPSRQFDCTLDSDCDLGRDMNEVKGSIQDLSDLCKDMLREINDLKSINLTLRCCVENLRHDNEQRDAIISELKRRLELLEGKHYKESTNSNLLHQVDGIEDKPARYIPNEIELRKTEVNESLANKISYDLEENDKEQFEDSLNGDVLPVVKTGKKEKEDIIIEKKSDGEKEEIDSQKDKWDSGKKQIEDAEIGYSDNESDSEDEKQTEKESDKATDIIKTEIISERKENKLGLSWSGNTTAELEKDNDASEEEEEEEESEDEPEEKETPRWKKLKEEIETVAKQEENDPILSTDIGLSVTRTDGNSQEKLQEEGEEKSWKVRKSVRWDENIEDESDTETDVSQSKFEEKHEEQSVADEDTAIADGDTIYEGDSVTDGEDRLGVLEEELLESPAPVLEGEHHLEDDELISENQPPKEPSETLIDSESRLDGAVTEQEQHIESEETKDGELRLEGVVGEDRELRLEGVVGEDRELRLEGVVDEDRELRFEKVVHEEGELRIEEGGEHGESRLEGDAADDRELRLEGADFQDEEYPEPPETPPHQHTEEDLWLYLKDCVSSVRPATVEEFVQNFIGTLQHVPEEFLKPVIDANIKRANSPSVSDGEHPTTPEGVRPEEGVLEESSSAKNQEENSESLGAEFQTPIQEVSSDFPEVSTAVKGAFFVGFWAFWLLHSVWGT